MKADPLRLKELLDTNGRPILMGILNVTPDSFSDGGKFNEVEMAVQHGLKMIEDGAAIIDIGGESTRPFADPVSLEEELRRTIPVIERLSIEDGATISIDTRHAEVAREALKAGASMVNDVSGLEGPGMEDLVFETGVPVVIMHMKGTPKDMQVSPSYDDVIDEVHGYLLGRVSALVERGMERDQIVIDPGIGFGKRVEDNLAIIRHIDRFSDIGCEILIGASRKSFIGHVLGKEVDERLEGSIVSAVMSYINGASILRVHDVIETRRSLDMTKAILYG